MKIDINIRIDKLSSNRSRYIIIACARVFLKEIYARDYLCFSDNMEFTWNH